MILSKFSEKVTMHFRYRMFYFCNLSETFDIIKMELLCKVCNKFVNNNYIVNNPNLDEIDKMFNDYVTSYIKNFDINAIRCQFFLVFAINFEKHIETDNCLNNGDLTKIKNYLLFWIDYYKSQGYSFCNINKMFVKTITDKHWMSHKIYIQYPLQLIERQINLVIERCPELLNTLDHTINPPITAKSSQIYVQ